MLTLSPGSTKNKEGRSVLMTDAVLKLVRAAVKGQSDDTFLIHYEDRSPVYDVRKEWWALCCSLGLGHMVCPLCEQRRPRVKVRGLDNGERPHIMVNGSCPLCGHMGREQYIGLLVHDLRRSAAKRMLLLDLSPKHMMDTGGWKTDSIMRRYQIKSHADLLAAHKKLNRPFA